jgi:hypothetical protein
VTGTSPAAAGAGAGTNGDAGAVAKGNRLRQPNTWLALTSYWRATTETEAPGTHDAATISRFSASGQRLLRRRSGFVSTFFVSMFASVDTSTSHAASDQRRESANQRTIKRRPSPDAYGGDLWASVATSPSAKRLQVCTLLLPV